MKNISKIFKIVGFNFLLLASILLRAQNNITDFKVDGGEFTFTQNDAQHPCISSQEYDLIDREVSDNLKKLHLENSVNKNTLSTSLIWPLRTAVGFIQCQYYFIGGYVDQNTAATAIQDFNCETNTYDGHQGTDIAIWPYGFNKIDDSQIEVIAAAAGTIIQKNDGNFDRNCSSNTLTANSIIIQHADGSYALYWHMKKNSVTTKTVGQTVVAGEYLGVVGSSGSSSGPHLHFEVWTGNTSATYKDPFSGSCNLLNANSWWASQKPHTDPAIMKVSVNTTDIAMATCPNSDVLTESDTFLVPFQGTGLSPGYAKFYIFTREIPANTTLSMAILNPNGTPFNSWTYIMPTFNKTRYYGFSKLLPTVDGTYTFQATYNGVTCSKMFTITHSLGISAAPDADYFRVFPNPTNDDFLVTANGIENENYTFTITNSIGQIVKKEKATIENNKLEKSFAVTSLSKGLYFLIIEGAKSRTVKKIVKNN
ncbi:peptidoglycan DD-metalloendopeptidase family protein [Flavobacterium paronense]|uniref:Peptidoglycan DD-metalloendopeptidase family protein n=1 Tax=Flavobacterium paronense TaxID=1392775 RepID=A0ABV5GD11_9FLAO|nr:peptidoglycan DD-metalloendopeptidase family protein [Flavobacterium paronense]MDN3676161.1 peptidoglycan DD-metalloendopeptidase family protein [Flavobacterium paronense]